MTEFLYPIYFHMVGITNLYVHILTFILHSYHPYMSWVNVCPVQLTWTLSIVKKYEGQLKWLRMYNVNVQPVIGQCNKIGTLILFLYQEYLCTPGWLCQPTMYLCNNLNMFYWSFITKEMHLLYVYNVKRIVRSLEPKDGKCAGTTLNACSQS